MLDKTGAPTAANWRPSGFKKKMLDVLTSEFTPNTHLRSSPCIEPSVDRASTVEIGIRSTLPAFVSTSSGVSVDTGLDGDGDEDGDGDGGGGE